MKNTTTNQLSVLSARDKTVRLVKMGMLVALSVIFVSTLHFKIIPAAPFLEYDPADIPILIGAFAFGPLAGIALTVVTSVIQGLTVSADGGFYGILMHIIATGTLVLVSSGIYYRNKTRKSALIGITLGILAMTGIMVVSNIIITPYFLGMPRAAVYPLLPFIVAFNLIKAGINGAATFVLYKKISPFLNR